MTPFDTDQAMKDFLAWRRYDSERQKHEDIAEKAVNDMFDAMERAVLDEIEMITGGE